MDRDKLLELASRVEAATEADREQARTAWHRIDAVPGREACADDREGSVMGRYVPGSITEACRGDRSLSGADCEAACIR